MPTVRLLANPNSSLPGLTPHSMWRFHSRMTAWVYILASKPRGTLYVGVTNDLLRRIHEHREGMVPGFTKSYGVCRLVYHERHETMPLAIAREKRIKRWRRAWKIELIESQNPKWRDLWNEIAR